ncbi:hypothetical protein [Thalassotalea ganghwensis]
MDLAGLLVASLSALGSLVQAFYTAKSDQGNVSKTTISKAKKRAKKPLKTGTKTVSAVIDDKLLLALSKQLEQHQSELITAFEARDINAEQTLINVEQARQNICHVLQQIKRFNQGDLPTKRLEKLWHSNGCDC